MSRPFCWVIGRETQERLNRNLRSLPYYRSGFASRNPRSHRPKGRSSMSSISRRHLLGAAAALAATTAAPAVAFAQAAAPAGPFTLPALGYPFNALEPHIDAKTMEIHTTRHHQA